MLSSLKKCSSFRDQFLGTVLLVMSATSFAELKIINSNGYSGLGMVPSAQILETGKASLAYENQMPGHLEGKGFDYNVGFGVTDSIEASARLTTLDLHCNGFVSGACPNGQIRDFSTSLKAHVPKSWVPLPWINDKNTSIAVGLTDFGGAASFFSSKYAVATRKMNQFQVSLGFAKASAPEPPLHGLFGGLQWNPNAWSQFSYDQIGRNAWGHSSIYGQLPNNPNYEFYLSLHHRINANPITEKNWMGFGVNIALSDVKEIKAISPEKSRWVKLPKIKRFDLQDYLAKNGLQKTKLGMREGKVFLWVDQENFQWNAMDAAGVALGLLASTFGDTAQEFQLIVGTRGLDVLGVSGLTSCLKKWFESDDGCASSLEIKSLVNHNLDLSGIKWEFDTTNMIRPELIISPSLVNVLGSDYGAFDLDLGASINPVITLWQGGFLETNTVVPLGIRTKNFNDRGPYSGSKITQQVTREVFHQVASLDSLNTQAMLSMGKIYKSWSGASMETNTYTRDGKNRFGLMGGKYENKELVFNTQKKYGLLSYRYEIENRYNASTEIVAGKFWSGDTGFNVSEKFWHGDVSLNFYYKRTRMSPNDQAISFAGFTIGMPLTPRTNSSFERLNLRGSNQFAYTAESKVGSTNNNLTGSMGEVPRTGDTLVQLSNRDRTADSYYQLRRERLRQAFLDLRVQDRKSWIYN